MDQATLTLADFLLARIAEDEAAARGHWQQDEWRVRREQGYPEGRYSVGPVREDDGGLSEAEAAYFARWQPARILAECEAKRRIVESFAAGEPYRRGTDSYAITGMVYQLLAMPYADHPDYRSEWKP